MEQKRITKTCDNCGFKWQEEPGQAKSHCDRCGFLVIAPVGYTKDGE